MQGNSPDSMMGKDLHFTCDLSIHGLSVRHLCCQFAIIFKRKMSSFTSDTVITVALTFCILYFRYVDKRETHLFQVIGEE